MKNIIDKIYNVIMIDDEPEMIKSISASLDWKSINCNNYGCFSSAEIALNFIKSNHIDIAFVDINMSPMDGLTFIKEAKKYNPNLISIILTCYNDFLHAQKAIQLGVYRYLIKQTLSEDEIVDVINEILNSSYYENTYKRNAEDVNAYFSKIITEKLSLKKIELLDQKLIDSDIAFKQTLVIEFVLFDQRYNILYVNFDEIRKNLSKFFSLIGRYYIFIYNSRVFVYVEIPKKSIVDKQYINLLLQDIGLQFPDNLIITLSKFFTWTNTTLSDCIEQFPTQNSLFYLDIGNHWIDYLKDNPVNPSSLFEPNKYLSIFKNALSEKDFNTLYALQKNIRIEILSDCINPESVKSMYKKIFLIFEYSFLSNDYAFSIDYTPCILYKCYDIKLLEIIDIFAECCQSNENYDYRKVLNSAIYYIDQNLFSDINREDIASFVHLNPSYFSRLFKKVKGINFSSYLLNKRLEKAYSMLIETDFSVAEISEKLQFKDPSYFYKSFKTKYGKAPNNVRKGKTSIQSLDL